ncbi:MAG: substrate-binding domain-containing protein, partial [bacterium]|nr:substrate-binding domain-containing protein [bacterium]
MANSPNVGILKLKVRMIPLRLGLLLVLVLSITMGACNRSSGRRIGVVPKAISLVFWQNVHAGAAAAGREEEVEILWRGPHSETDFSRQIEIVDSMINARVDGIVVAPTDRKALVTVVERAQRSGIPVTIFDSGIDTDSYVSYVATNNYEGGVMGARKLAGILNGKGKVALVRMVPGSVSTTNREEGFKQTIAKEFPGIEIVAEDYCMADHARALAVAENFLTAHPGLDG